MTDHEEFVADLAYPQRDVIQVNLDDVDLSEFGNLPAVIDIAYRGRHFVVAPFALVDDFTVEVAIFDDEGFKRHHRVMSVMSGDTPFATGGEPE